MDAIDKLIILFLGDEGVVHSLVHLLNGTIDSKREIRRARGRFEALQNSVKGMWNK